MQKKEHWENVFATKQETEVSWYQAIPQTSIDLFEAYSIPLSANIIDVGCGDSYFVDYLVRKGYQNIYALDISEHAIARLKKRLGSDASKVNWIVSDILDLNTEIKFDFWHDRAVFHFLTIPENISTYKALVNDRISEKGKMLIATFSKSGPKKCSGLDVCQYGETELVQAFSEHFNCINQKAITHFTPFASTQEFTFCLFEKRV